MGAFWPTWLRRPVALLPSQGRLGVLEGGCKAVGEEVVVEEEVGFLGLAVRFLPRQLRAVGRLLLAPRPPPLPWPHPPAASFTKGR